MVSQLLPFALNTTPSKMPLEGADRKVQKFRGMRLLSPELMLTEANGNT